MVRYAGCCNRCPATRSLVHHAGPGVTFHLDCQNAVDNDPNRRVDVEMDSTRSKLSGPNPGDLDDGRHAGGYQQFHHCNEATSPCEGGYSEEMGAIGTFEVEIRDLSHLKKGDEGPGKKRGDGVERMGVKGNGVTVLRHGP